jgi:hypothetical protein
LAFFQYGTISCTDLMSDFDSIFDIFKSKDMLSNAE